ncbi:glycoside hydrolase [Photobacterium sp. TY1-4]|uniref:glycoside hydrolase n=1 Tax=Photobacterium sp. TY1-4 TaxID=2899122 RepID=UPI0021BF1AD1|nr:glycoside hydrolase [Photobacterium sp. TY1-4]UXI03093.1 glycoside hydrolase [Photobacterium sp. TY1-4]
MSLFIPALQRGVFLSLLLAAVAGSTQAAEITLSGGDQAVTLDPQTLSIRWGDVQVNQAALRIDGKPQSVTALHQNATHQASWTLMPAKIRVSASLDQALSLTFTIDDTVTIARNHPVTLAWFDLPHQATRTLYLPFSEGMRVPTDHPVWAKYLQQHHSGANTTQDLKMPFWTAEQADTFVSYHLVTATSNLLTFTEAAGALPGLNASAGVGAKASAQDGKPQLDMQANHQFTALNRDQAFVVRISLGKDPLSGARQYRQWRAEHHQAQPLAAKLQRNPALKKLIGASQVYLFGKDVLAEQDVKDWWGLKNWLTTHPELPLSKAARQELGSLKQGQDWLNRYHKQLLVDSLNAALNQLFPAEPVQLDNNTIESQFNAAQLRKLWLSNQAGQFLTPPDRWGQGLASSMITNLQAAGLSKLWLGLDNWMPAFYQPQVVEQAKSAGYLVGTYDSYNTAIPAGLNDGWLTAQLPDEMRIGCAIEQADGTTKKGFRGHGFYLNPNCRRGYVEQRIRDIAHYGRFDSLFLDVDATAMAREDYRDGTSEQQMLQAFNDRMQWIADSTSMILGSEDGNSLTTRGIAFAHGLETVGFGWSDPDMKNNRRSPYFLGRWYPEHRPEFFFQPAKVKAPYQTLLFAPQFRVPLYQAVFHDEVINSHHWHSDSLKFSNVRSERDLIGMLYNTPAMVHLSREDASSPHSPRIKALKHYQDGYLPLHRALWDQPLVDFRWLDNEGWLQQTTFGDGSRVIANFSGQVRHDQQLALPPQSIIALLSDGTVFRWQSQPAS